MDAATRAIRVAAALALAAVVLALAPGCSTTAVRPEAVRTAEAHDGLGCTPLAIIIAGENMLGLGSGVLVHPRVLLTAAHVVHEHPQRLIAQGFRNDPYESESMRIERVVKGGGGGAVAGDWALLVLERPFAGLKVKPAELPETAPALAPGDAVIIAGFPADGRLLDRRPLLVHSVCINPPLGATVERDGVYVRGTRGQPDRAALSGAPVLIGGSAGDPVLAGVYLGSFTRHIIGILLGQEMVIHALPLEEIRRVIAEVEVEDRASGATLEHRGRAPGRM